MFGIPYVYTQSRILKVRRPQQGTAMLIREEALPQWLGALPVIPR